MIWASVCGRRRKTLGNKCDPDVGLDDVPTYIPTLASIAAVGLNELL
jgi:hypothetical protein